jgi:hypothetical protein
MRHSRFGQSGPDTGSSAVERRLDRNPERQSRPSSPSRCAVAATAAGYLNSHHVQLLSWQRTVGNKAVTRSLGRDPTSSGLPPIVIQSLRYKQIKRGTKDLEEITKSVEEVYESLVVKGHRITVENALDKENVRKVLQQIEEQFAQSPFGDLLNWADLTKMVKTRLAAMKNAPPKATHATFRDLIDRGDQITIGVLKEYLALPEDTQRSDVWKTAQALGANTYLKQQENVKVPDDIAEIIKAVRALKRKARETRTASTNADSKGGPKADPYALKNFLSEEQQRRFEGYTRLAGLAGASRKQWMDSDVIPPDLILALAKSEADALMVRSKQQARGIPPEVIEMDAGAAGKLFVPEKSETKAGLAQLGEENASTVATMLTSDPPTPGLAYLRGQMMKLLMRIAPHWTKIKPAGQAEIVRMIVSKSTDIGDAKGTVGELTAVLFAVARGEAVNVGGPDKKLPGGQIIGGIGTQDVDVRYIQGGDTRVYIEAKYDTKTLIEKFEGEKVEVPRATTDGAGEEKETESTASQVLTDKEQRQWVKAKQQKRYEAMLAKKSTMNKASGRAISRRELCAVISNPHDWLLLFISGGSGKRVARWLAEAKWTIVVEDDPISPELNLELLDAVPGYCKMYKNRSETPEQWAERVSTTCRPSSFLKLVDFLPSGEASGSGLSDDEDMAGLPIRENATTTAVPAAAPGGRYRFPAHTGDPPIPSLSEGTLILFAPPNGEVIKMRVTAETVNRGRDFYAVAVDDPTYVVMPAHSDFGTSWVLASSLRDRSESEHS